MPIGRKMPNGTRVKHGTKGTGKTLAYLSQMQPAGGYTVQWDNDGSSSDARISELELESGAVTEDAYKACLQNITNKMGGYNAKSEGSWLQNGNLVASVLVISKPAHLGVGQEMHAHVSTGGGLRKAHVKNVNSNQYIRDVFANGGTTAQATVEDCQWVSNYKIYNNMKNNKQNYLDSKTALPKV